MAEAIWECHGPAPDFNILAVDEVVMEHTFPSLQRATTHHNKLVSSEIRKKDRKSSLCWTHIRPANYYAQYAQAASNAGAVAATMQPYGSPSASASGVREYRIDGMTFD